MYGVLSATDQVFHKINPSTGAGTFNLLPKSSGSDKAFSPSEYYMHKSDGIYTDDINIIDVNTGSA